ncbi:CoA pyrophosphatase [uncultured Cedecea sp.]|uniref:CoA pyrophosphatase n=1 Tax=uncultured Cedecea sp. TaxID=988762 RepID=UPI002634BD4E|nr:CoA pyrophosphatase [uncultured Cedecea sp.]
MTLDNFLARFQLLQPDSRPPVNHQREAAVLVPIVRRPKPGLLLTQRSLTLRKHPGEVAFPGGSVDKTDESLIATALRETYEEIAIPPQAVEVIGRLPSIDSVTGFRVTPILGIISPDVPLQASADEVAAIFEMPLEEALTTGRYHPLDIQRRKIPHRVWLSWYESYFVWGMTASIIRTLSLQVNCNTDNTFRR